MLEERNEFTKSSSGKSRMGLGNICTTVVILFVQRIFRWLYSRGVGSA